MDEYITPELSALVNSIKELTNISEENLTDEMMGAILDSVDQNFKTQIGAQAINQIIAGFDEQNLTKVDAMGAIHALKELLNEMVYGENVYTGNKKLLVDSVMLKLFEVFDTAVDKYHSYSIELPMTLEDGAQVPTYAHETDAAADLYAADTVVVKAHTYGNMIRTGVHIQLPEGWVAYILPRSSIGAKTPLRLSNSVGVIDSGYRGPLGVLYDNTSDTDYTITAGDRIAQLLVMPSYRFKANVVETLEDSDRGSTGFGDSGK